MKIGAVVATEKGGPGVLKRAQVDLAWPRGPLDVLVELKAAALNPAAIFFRQLGGYVAGPEPFVLGHDGMGIVREVGPEVTLVKPGDRVCFCNGGIGGTLGTYAEAAVVPEWQLARVPDTVDDLTAAALPLVAITCWESLYERAAVQAVLDSKQREAEAAEAEKRAAAEQAAREKAACLAAKQAVGSPSVVGTYPLSFEAQD